VRLPEIDQNMSNCEPPRRWSVGGVRYTLSVAGDSQVDTTLRVQAGEEYSRFVPEPGAKLVFTASLPTGEARFRFELDRAGTSRFPGYASNANIDDVFFVKHNLSHLRGQYTNHDPDVIFDPEDFGTAGWSRSEPGVIETRTAERSAVVTVTTMDYGAVGEIRAYVNSPDCGGTWQPANLVVNGQPRDAFAIPLDEDNNLIADALEQYRGIDSGADDDAEPKDNGIAGDGLTAFEEYRGFETRGTACPGQPETSYAEPEPGMPAPEPFPDEERPSDIPGWDDVHIRTPPNHKDLFVHALDPELAAMTEQFAWASDLRVHAICEPHYAGNDTRVINFTLQQANRREWRRKRISQDDPQHGIWVVALDSPVQAVQTASLLVIFDLGGLVGAAVNASRDMALEGPPKFTLAVAMIKPYLISERQSHELPRSYRRRVSEDTAYFSWVLTHELSHAVGVPHHGDGITNFRTVPGKMNVTTRTSAFQRSGGPMPVVSVDEERRTLEQNNLGGLIVLNADCDESEKMYRDGQFVGCWAESIARRGQQNSGHFECPMRYPYSSYYEPPGVTAVYRWTGFVDGGPGHVNVDAWGGDLSKYQNDLDRSGTGKLCTSVRGTEINALPGKMNHNGDAGRDKSCREFLVVNDVAARGLQ
jgi:hypothetical protein